MDTFCFALFVGTIIAFSVSSVDNTMLRPNQGERQSFPELLGRNAHEAAAYIAALGLKPALIRAGQSLTMDYRLDRVRIVTDPSGNTVIQIPGTG